MLDYIKNRIEAIRNTRVLDFMTEYMKKRGSELEGFRGENLQDLQNRLQSLPYANVVKKQKSSSIKQTNIRKET